MTYEVDQILVVEPHEVEPLQVEAGKDLCTLVTCTPYGVNSHRLLVRGHRVENPEDAVTLRVTADAYRIEPLTVAPVVAVPILLVVLWIMGIADRINRRKNPIGKQVDIDE
jgi:sortase A